MIFSKFTKLCNHRPNLASKHFHRIRFFMPVCSYSPGNCYSTSCPYRFTHSGHFIEMATFRCHRRSFGPGFFQLASCFGGVHMLWPHCRIVVHCTDVPHFIYSSVIGSWVVFIIVQTIVKNAAFSRSVCGLEIKCFYFSWVDSPRAQLLGHMANLNETF